MIDKTKAPSALSFPQQFNPHAADLWFAVLSRLPTNPEEAWRVATERFVNLCHEKDLYPFRTVKDNNLAVKLFLYKRRMAFIRLMNFTKLMVGVPIIRLIDRKAKSTDYGFDITITCQVYMKDPTWVRKLKNFGIYRFNLMREERKKYVRHVDPGLTVFVYNDGISNPQSWHIGYTIKCPIHPDFGDLPTNQHEWFILEQLWKPLQNKFRGLHLDPIRQI